MPLNAQVLVDLVDYVGRVKALTDQHPELFHVAQELMTMKGPLPVLGSNGRDSHTATTATGATENPKRRAYKGLHWTQRPENKRKVAKMLKAAQRARRQG